MRKLYKYPKTMHLPWSPGLQNDDRLIESLQGFEDRIVTVTEKMDGENATLYRDHYHARSLDSRHHPSRDWVKAFHSQIKRDIPEGWRVCGENMYAVHSVKYQDLESYFLGFSVWNDKNECLSWGDTLEFFEMIGVTPVSVLYQGLWAEDMIHDIAENVDHNRQEGFVVRIYDSFHFDDFKKYVAKWVRKGHVQTDEHWMSKPVEPNGLWK